MHKRPCMEPGCPELLTGRRSRCPTHSNPGQQPGQHTVRAGKDRWNHVRSDKCGMREGDGAPCNHVHYARGLCKKHWRELQLDEVTVVELPEPGRESVDRSADAKARWLRLSVEAREAMLNRQLTDDELAASLPPDSEDEPFVGPGGRIWV